MCVCVFVCVFVCVYVCLCVCVCLVPKLLCDDERKIKSTTHLLGQEKRGAREIVIALKYDKTTSSKRRVVSPPLPLHSSNFYSTHTAVG